MSVQFEEEQKFNERFNNPSSGSNSGLTGWFIKNGFAKNENGARTVMTIITVLCFAVAIFFMFKQ